MAITAIFREVKNFTEREIERLRQQTAEDIFWQLGKIFCIDEAKFDAEKERYEQIIPYCSYLLTADRKNVYVAKCDFLMMTSDKIVLNCMNGFADYVDGIYADVTEFAGESIEGVATRCMSCISEAASYTKEDLVNRKIKTRIPSPREGGRIFYNVS